MKTEKFTELTEGYYKLVDKEGWLILNEINTQLYQYFENDLIFIEEIVDGCGFADIEMLNYFIADDEYQYFEKVFEEDEKGNLSEVKFTPIINEACEASCADDLETWFKFIPRAKYKPHYLNGEYYVGDVQSEDVSWKVDQLHEEHFVFRPIKKKTLHERLCEEFGKDYMENGGKFLQDELPSAQDIFDKAKRIIELSGGK